MPLHLKNRSDRTFRPYEKRRRTSLTTIIGILVFLVFILLLALLSRMILQNRAERQRQADPWNELESSTETAEGSENQEDAEPINTYQGLEDINSEVLSIDRYFIYGSHLYFSGTMTTLPQLKTLEVVLRPINESIDLGSWEMYWTVDNNTTSFSSSRTITEGPDLNAFPPGEYALLIKLTASNGDVQYRHISDLSDNDPFDFYTVTRNGSNRKVQIETQSDTVHLVHYWGVHVEETELPEDVYDIVIDPGHGGNDTGAVSRDGLQTEADLVMPIAQKAYDKLTEQGYKVLLTRDGTESDDEDMLYSMYDEDGRVNVSCRSRAKYAITLHIASSDNTNRRGYAIYGTVRGNDSFSKVIAEALNQDTHAVISQEEDFRMDEGIYEIPAAGYWEMGLFNNVDDLYMIRELGGIATGARVTGSDVYGDNLFIDSIQGVECCHVDLGFITNSADLSDLTDHPDDYAEAVADAFIAQSEIAPLLDPSTAPKAIPSPQARRAAESSNEESSAD